MEIQTASLTKCFLGLIIFMARELIKIGPNMEFHEGHFIYKWSFRTKRTFSVQTNHDIDQVVPIRMPESSPFQFLFCLCLKMFP